MKQINNFIDIKQDKMIYRFLPTGDIFTFTYENFLINQFRGNVKDGSANNIYLRIYHPDNVTFYPLLGIHSASTVSFSAEAIIYKGVQEEISYQVIFRPVNNIWFWNVTLSGTDKQIDLVYGQDIGIAEAASVYTNELYMSQYLGHSIFKETESYVVCSRQNLPCSGLFPYIQQGVIGVKAVHYSTDGLQFFGLSYKRTDIPEILTGDLQDYNLQYEFSYTALQTEKINLNGDIALSFYGIFTPSHPDAIKEIEYQDLLVQAFEKSLSPIASFTPLACIKIKEEFGLPYSSPSFSKKEMNRFFPSRILEETKQKQLLSFFTEDHSHVVTKKKELLSERPHGSIIITPPNSDYPDNPILASTQSMYGVFNSHVVVGNTDFHKFMSTSRGFLNLMKNSGQRLYVRINGRYRLLTLPAAYEMGMNYSKWYYKIPYDVLAVTVYTAVSTPDLIMEVSSNHNKVYDYIITNQITMGTNEYSKDIVSREIKDGLRFDLNNDVYPGLHYNITIPGHSFTINDDRIFFEDEIASDETFLTFSLKHDSGFQLIIKSYLSEEERIPNKQYKFEQELISDKQYQLEEDLILDKQYHFEEEKNAALLIYQKLINNFHLDNGSDSMERIAILNETVWWYAHNAMIHYHMPHGLEQSGGAAWGTRDVCQGPMEFFLATQNYAEIRRILLILFSHQNSETKEWPQWFMFDRYTASCKECHGDVIFWPLKSVADYILASGDDAILSEVLPYADSPDQKDTLLSHINNALLNIKDTRFIKDTGLITYAGGDWDDTLQPAHEELKEKLVSSWTVALAYQTFTSLAEALDSASHNLSEELDSTSFNLSMEQDSASYDLSMKQDSTSYDLSKKLDSTSHNLSKELDLTSYNLSKELNSTSHDLSKELNSLALKIKDSFLNILIKDRTIAGFLECGEDYHYMLHPADHSTGIHYRLLPMTRSIIAELVDLDQAKQNVAEIHDHLKCPDGIRLMDFPAHYDGGVSHLFKRAEQAANVGREISLQYAHSNIRYIEAMAKLGDCREAWNSLFIINPILINHSVANAAIRQSNTYFSSSDGAYHDRYDYEKNFHLLRSGKIKVKGGWRLYSSGPGIYFRQLVNSICGITFRKEGILLDPVLPTELDGLLFTYTCFDRIFNFRYRIAESNSLHAECNGIPIPSSIVPNPYRCGGILIRKEDLMGCEDEIIIYTKGSD